MFFGNSCLGHYVLIKPSFVGWSPYSVVNLVFQLLTVSLLVFNGVFRVLITILENES